MSCACFVLFACVNVCPCGWFACPPFCCTFMPPIFLLWLCVRCVFFCCVYLSQTLFLVVMFWPFVRVYCVVYLLLCAPVRHFICHRFVVFLCYGYNRCGCVVVVLFICVSPSLSTSLSGGCFDNF